MTLDQEGGIDSEYVSCGDCYNSINSIKANEKSCAPVPVCSCLGINGFLCEDNMECTCL